MKKRIGQKVIILIISFVLISTPTIYPLTLNAEVKLNWDNPNQGKNPYKFKLSDYLNSAMSIVGCTGIVNKVSKYMTGLLQSKDYKMKMDMMQTNITEAQCLAWELGLISGTGSIPNVTISNAPQTVAEYCKTQKMKDPQLYDQAIKQTQIDESSKFRDECLNGIAYTLAKNQLTAMTKQTMNWVTSGFNGDPMYVRNMNSFVRSIEDEILYQELEMFKDTEGNYDTTNYPYGRSLSRSIINSRQSAENFAGSMQQDLTNYLTDGATIEEFSSDFSKGGWYGYLGLTQHSQNNPLGATMKFSQYIADKQAQEVENTKDELNRNNGILDQKKCAVYKETVKYDEATNTMKTVTTDTCLVWETITPGSLIQDKVSSYLGSPERQLEMADSINEVLNVVFAKLIDKLRLDGLSSLNSESYTNLSGGVGSNWTTPIQYIDVDGNITTNKYAASGYDENRAFDLTKDLGNIYNHSDVIDLGTWNANINKTYPKTGESGSLIPMKGQANTYYTVSVAGKTKLFEDDVLGWEVGDRAFFNGSSWQNWKKGTTSPIAKKGIIQIQKDYIVIAQELLKVMPAVMPSLGELDYCIPGPNPNWQANSSNAYEAFSDWVSGLEASYYAKGVDGDRKPSKERVNIIEPSENPNSSVYKNYKNIFINSPTRWWKIHDEGQTKILAYMRVLANSDHSNMDGDWIGDDMIMAANNEVGELIQNIFESLDVFNKEYPIHMEEVYGTIQQQFIRNEKTGINTTNPKWIPMAKDGLTLTKKMTSYDEEIIEANKDLKDAITEADSVIYKLELIKNDVSKIIKQAQDRRDKAITEALNADPYNEGYTTNTAYKSKNEYGECLDEENIDYLDYTELIINSEKNNCSDDLDNDFDGLVDSQDPDCGGSSGVNRRNNSTSGVYRESNSY